MITCTVHTIGAMGCNILGIHELHPMMKMRQIQTDDDQILEMPKMMQKNVLRS